MSNSQGKGVGANVVQSDPSGAVGAENRRERGLARGRFGRMDIRPPAGSAARSSVGALLWHGCAELAVPGIVGGRRQALGSGYFARGAKSSGIQGPQPLGRKASTGGDQS